MGRESPGRIQEGLRETLGQGWSDWQCSDLFKRVEHLGCILGISKPFAMCHVPVQRWVNNCYNCYDVLPNFARIFTSRWRRALRTPGPADIAMTIRLRMDVVWTWYGLQNGLKIGLRISGQDKNEQHLWLGAVQLWPTTILGISRSVKSILALGMCLLDRTPPTQTQTCSNMGRVDLENTPMFGIRLGKPMTL